MDKEIILAIIEKYNGGPVGLNTLSVAVNEDPGTIEEVYEPFLIQQGFHSDERQEEEKPQLLLIKDLAKINLILETLSHFLNN